jgi:hypothetical protein
MVTLVRSDARARTGKTVLPVLAVVLAGGGAAQPALATAAAETRSSPVVRPIFTIGATRARQAHIRPAKTRAAFFRFQLPPGARQGPKVWYVIRLHLAVEFAPSSGPGHAFLFGDTNGRTAAMIQFSASAEADRATAIRWSSIDLVNGRRERAIQGRKTRITFVNYLQRAGVRGGENELSLTLEQFGRLRVRSVTIFGQSGIYKTLDAPARLKLEGSLLPDEVHVGENFTIRVRVRNLGDLSARRVTLGANAPAEIEILGDHPVRLGEVRKRATADLRFRAIAPGVHRIMIGATSTANRPGTVVAVAVQGEPAAQEGTRVRYAVAAVAVGAGLLLSLTDLTRKRRSRRLPDVAQ